MKRHPIPLALHVCGGARRRLLREGHLDGFKALARFDRVQLNGAFTEEEAAQLERLLAASPAQQSIITQHDATPLLASRIAHERHQVLFDASGGQGITRAEWPRPLPEKACGYAGGPGPLTIERELPRIEAAAEGAPYWIDMESRLRDEHDRFSFNDAHAVLDAIERMEKGRRRLLPRHQVRGAEG